MLCNGHVISWWVSGGRRGDGASPGALSIASEAGSPPARRLSSLGARREPVDGVGWWCSMPNHVLVLPDIQVSLTQVLFRGIELPLILFSRLLFTAISLVAQGFMLATVVTCRR